MFPPVAYGFGQAGYPYGMPQQHHHHHHHHHRRGMQGQQPWGQQQQPWGRPRPAPPQMPYGGGYAPPPPPPAMPYAVPYGVPYAAPAPPAIPGYAPPPPAPPVLPGAGYAAPPPPPAIPGAAPPPPPRVAYGYGFGQIGDMEGWDQPHGWPTPWAHHFRHHHRHPWMGFGYGPGYGYGRDQPVDPSLYPPGFDIVGSLALLQGQLSQGQPLSGWQGLDHQMHGAGWTPLGNGIFQSQDQPQLAYDSRRNQFVHSPGHGLGGRGFGMRGYGMRGYGMPHPHRRGMYGYGFGKGGGGGGHHGGHHGSHHHGHHHHHHYVPPPPDWDDDTDDDTDDDNGNGNNGAGYGYGFGARGRRGGFGQRGMRGGFPSPWSWTPHRRRHWFQPQPQIVYLPAPDPYSNNGDDNGVAFGYRGWRHTGHGRLHPEQPYFWRHRPIRHPDDWTDPAVYPGWLNGDDAGVGFGGMPWVPLAAGWLAGGMTPQSWFPWNWSWPSWLPKGPGAGFGYGYGDDNGNGNGNGNGFNFQVDMDAIRRRLATLPRHHPAHRHFRRFHDAWQDVRRGVWGRRR